MAWFRRFGPGLVVTAAFIGPGTVTTCTLAGATFGWSLLWVVLLATAATIILQEMSARLGIVTRHGLGEALRASFRRPVSRGAVVALIVATIAFGNAAFQWGNITGTSMGLEVVTGIPRRVWCVVAGVAAAALLWTGRYAVLERVLVGLVALMSVVFVTTALMVHPEPGRLVRRLTEPRLPTGSLTTAIALIGTTVVPYNLFLHASAAAQKWPASVPTAMALRESRQDTVLSISLGGLLSLAIVITAAAFFERGASITDAGAMAGQLEPLMGPLAKWCFAAGLTAAGFTSALTAPLAAAYAVSGALGWAADQQRWRFRAVWLGVALAGTMMAAVGRKPVASIVLAQAANGLILPVVAAFLLVVTSRRESVGEFRNRAVTNVLGAAVVLLVAGLGAYTVLTKLAGR